MSSKITFKFSLLIASEMLTFKEHSIKKKAKVQVLTLATHVHMCQDFIVSL